ncbi:MAG: phospho-sugar mutase [Clostridiales bacterium]|nr:phospho-sugar mutase [Clostridiales bacterium]
MNYYTNYQRWLKSESLDEESRKELLDISNNPGEIEERFCKNLRFSTGGIRGIIGAGTNRINRYVIRQQVQGLSNYIKKNFSKKHSVVIAYDSRHLSSEFALDAALVLCANNIKAYIFESLRPTPELSFAVRHSKCSAGIVITASHNPHEYNGYKVYGADGAQITMGLADQIMRETDCLDIFNDIFVISKEEGLKKGLLVYIGKEVDDAYLSEFSTLPSHLSDSDKSLRIVYTPLHGAGANIVPKALLLRGYNNISLVDSQFEPDGDFPTVKSPNPGEKEVFKESIILAEKINADLIIATDPDCDRIGVGIKNDSGGFSLLSGNQTGALLINYILSIKEDVVFEDAVIKTIVTSDLGAVIAKSYGATVFETLTGFKYIGEKIGEFEKNNSYRFLFGYEESYGYLAGTFVRDKDAVIAAVLIVDMVDYYKGKGLSVFEVLNNLYEKYGYYEDALESFILNGNDCRKRYDKIYSIFRSSDSVLKYFPNCEIIENYELGEKLFLKTGSKEELELPKACVVKIYLSDGSWVAVRPSGTEPKLKFYYSSHGKSESEVKKRAETIKGIIHKIMGKND